MQKYLMALLSIALLTPWVGFAPPMEAAQTPPSGNSFARETLKQRAMDAYLNLPLYFVANRGQMDENVAYYAQGGGHSIYFTAEEVVVALDETVLRLRFVGARATPPVGVEKRAAKANYFIGNDPAKWQTNVPTYGEVVYHELYPGIDLRYAGQNGALKYAFVVQPGADVSQIRLAYGGATGLRLDGEGNLLIQAGGSELKDTRPYAYQEIGGRRVEVETEFVLHGVRTCGFAVQGDYDRHYPLVVDPTLIYSTYLGGSAYDRGFGIAVDGSGHAYVTGETLSTDFPTQNPYQGACGGCTTYTDAFVTKIDTTKSGAASLVYSTYLGGSDYEWGYSVAVDGAGHTYVTGFTGSTNFPTQNAYQGDQGGADAFVAKLNAAGNDLVYSTYLGGSGDDYGRGIAVDGAGNAYMTGLTGSTNFPTQNPYQGTHSGGTYDAFVTKLNATGSGLLYSTYLGGNGDDQGYGIVVDGNGKAYVTGETNSTDFPTQNPHQPTNAGLSDAFVTKLNAMGNALLYSTYLGGSNNDTIGGIAIDGAGHAYVTGGTESTNFPTRNSYQGDQGGGDAFVARLELPEAVYLPAIMKSYAPFCNGDFEQGTSCWSFGGMERHTVSTAMPHGGSQSALLGGDKSVYGCDGGVPQGSAWMEQTFNVPDEGSPKLSFWYRLYSYDKTKERARVDSFEVKVNGATVFEDLLTWATAYGCDKPPNDGGWQQVTLDLSAYKGQTITLHFEVWNRADNWYNTWAYIDDVSVQ